ncbi:DUF1684 domain-containing protein [soil metagenome]
MTILAGCGGNAGQGDPATPPEDYRTQVQAWRDTHEADYRRDFVTIAGLHFLEPGTHTIGSARANDIVLEAAVPPVIGRLTVADERVHFAAAEGVAVSHKGQRLTAPAVLKEPGSRPTEGVVVGAVSLVVHVTGDRLALRVRDPDGELARAFAGFSWFPIDPGYRVIGRFIRDAEPRKLPVMNTFNMVDLYDSEGVVEFALHGQTLRLRPFTTRPKRFYIVLRDASSGTETYEAARFLYADLLDDGTTVLDFNQAYNPPCAFNRYTTCPIPLKENVLPVKILAGEKAYAGGSTKPRLDGSEARSDLVGPTFQVGRARLRAGSSY